MFRLIILILLFHKTAFSDVLTFDISNKFVSISENKSWFDFLVPVGPLWAFAGRHASLQPRPAGIRWSMCHLWKRQPPQVDRWPWLQSGPPGAQRWSWHGSQPSSCYSLDRDQLCRKNLIPWWSCRIWHLSLERSVLITTSTSRQHVCTARIAPWRVTCEYASAWSELTTPTPGRPWYSDSM